ncbi:FecR family protein [Flavitalea flava]
MERIKFLLSKYLANQAEEEEIQEILQWLRNHEHNEALLQEIWEQQPSPAPAADLQRMWMNIEASTLPVPILRLPFLRRNWQAVAAVFLLLVSGGWLLVNNHNHTTPAGQPPVAVQEIAPGKNGAVLTLADGSNISLDSTGNGVIANQKGTQVLLKNGQLEYDETGKASGEIVYNIMTTPKGRQFNLVLPDGSRVWLNAASSIKFPTAFKGNTRSVEITGEAYFEVAKDKNKPFFVKAMNTETEVLGTHFNINAYEEEGIVKATLLAGSIRTTALNSARPGDAALLQPGEQAQIRPNEKLIVVPNTDIEQTIAWKNGAFNFQNIGLKEVMRQLARWYDLQIVYEKNVPNIIFGGEMSRNITLSDLLNGLKDMDVHFRIEEGHKLIVMP